MNYCIFLALCITFELGALSITQYIELARIYKAQPTDARRKELVAEYHAFRADLDRRLADNALKVLLGKRISELEQPAPAIPPAPPAPPTRALPAAPTAAQFAQLRSEADDLRRALEKCQSELELCRSGAIEGTQLLEKELTACKTQVEQLKTGGGAQRDATKQLAALTTELDKCKVELKQSKDQLAAQGARTGLAGAAGALLGAGAVSLAGAGPSATEAQLKQCQDRLAAADAALKQQSEKLTHEIESTRKEAKEQRNRFEEDLAKREEDLRRMRESTDKQIKDLEDQLKRAAQGEKKAAAPEAESAQYLEARKAARLERCAKLEKEIEASQKRQAEYEAQLKASKAGLEESHKELEEIKLKSKIEWWTKRNQELQAKIDQLTEHFKTELEARAKRLQGAAKEEKAAEQQKAAYEEQIKKLQNDLKQLHTELGTCAKDVEKHILEDRAKRFIAQYSAAVDKLRTETDAIQLAEGAARYQQIKDELIGDIANLQRSFGKNAPEDLDALEERLRKIDLSLALQHARDLFEKVNATKSKCTEELKTLQNQYESLKEENDKLREGEQKRAEEERRK